MPDFEKINLPGGKNKPEDNERDLLKKQQEIYDRLRAKNEEGKEGDILSFSDAEELEKFQKNRKRREPKFWQDEEETRMVAIANLAKLGKSGEKTLCKIFKKNLKADQIFQRKELQRVTLSHSGKLNPEDYEDSDYEYDERDVIDDFELKSGDNPNYAYNDFILKQLKKITGPKTVDFAVKLLAEDQNAFSLYYHGLKDLLANPNQKDYAAEKLFEHLRNDKLQDKKVFRLIITLTDLLSAEEARLKIDEEITREKDQTAKDNLKHARGFFTPDYNAEAVHKLRDFYENNIKFEEYGLNEKMNQEEAALLKDLFKKYISQDGKIVEMGCGAGRLLLELEKAGYDISGYDFTPRHLKLIRDNEQKKKDRGEIVERPAKIFQGDWQENGLRNESCDVIYSLGRNILHEYSLPRQLQLFREAARALKTGGKFIFDIPDRNQGGYAELVKEYAKQMQAHGVRNYREGAIYDSPNSHKAHEDNNEAEPGENGQPVKSHYMTRYVYSQDDIEQLAKLAGFKIMEKIEKPLPTGKGDVNIYYVLEKAA